MEKMSFSPQVDTVHYGFSHYADKPRFCSYWHQVDEVAAVAPKRLLVVGVGDELVPVLINKALPDTDVVTFDFDPALKPDIVGDVREIASVIPADSFDCVLCCQVLEHLPYEYFAPVLQAFSKIAPKLVLSVPCRFHRFGIALDLPKLHVGKFFYTERRGMNFSFNGEHYWEAGTKNTSIRDVCESIRTVYTVKKNYRVPEKPQHMFFVCERKND